MSVLVVSRLPAVRKQLSAQVRRAGLKVEAALDGDDAFRRIASVRPRVAIADLTDAEEEDLLFVALLRKRHPGIAVVSLYEGKLRVVYGSDERLLDHDGLLPSDEILADALEWGRSLQLLETIRPKVASA